MYHPLYGHTLHNPQLLTKAADKVGRWCKERSIKAVACRGVSGIVVASVASALYDLDLIVVRKPEEHARTQVLVQGPDSHNLNYVIVDDFVSTGATIRKIIEGIALVEPSARCLCVLTYDQLMNSPTSTAGVPIIQLHF